MKRTIKPFTVEVRRGRKDPAAWPTISEPVPVYPKLGRSSPQPVVVLHHAEQPATPPWAGARILPAMELPHPASDEQRHGAALDHVGSRAEPVQECMEHQDEAPPQARQRREKPAQAAAVTAAAEQQRQAGTEEDSAAAVARIIMQTSKAAAAPDAGSADAPERLTFRRGERWRSRLPAVVVRKLAQRQRRGKPAVNAAE